jgi:hypothetical protein
LSVQGTKNRFKDHPGSIRATQSQGITPHRCHLVRLPEQPVYTPSQGSGIAGFHGRAVFECTNEQNLYDYQTYTFYFVESVGLKASLNRSVIMSVWSRRF